MKQKPLILYHNNCLDGFSGAWAAWKKFGSRAEYRGLEHQESPPKDFAGRTLYFIDFSYPYDVMKRIVEKSERTIVLDHHISQETSVALAHEKRFSLDHSGCELAWQYFHPQKKTPWFLEAVQDNDLHRFSRSHTRETIAYVAGFPMSFAQWSAFVRAYEPPTSRKKLIEKGKLLLQYKNQLIAKIIAKAEKVRFCGKTTYAANTPLFYSDTANALVKKHHLEFGITWFYKKGKFHISLRANGTSKIDVSKIALRYGGGGHKKAAGFTVLATQGFPWKGI